MTQEKLWKNWAGNLECRAHVCEPKSLPELKREVQEAAKKGRIRTAGGSKSWAPLVPTNDTILVMDGLAKKFGSNGGAIEIECGMTIGKLTNVTREDWTPVSPPVFPEPTVGGVVATGSHGTGFEVSNFAEQVNWIKIIQADGTERTVNRADAEFDAARVSLGTLGVAYSIELELEEQFNVHIDTRRLPIEKVLENFDDLPNSCEYLEMFWFPGAEDIWLMFMNRTDSDADPKGWWTKLKKTLNRWLQKLVVEGALPWIARYRKSWIRTLNRLASELGMEDGITVQEASDAFHFLDAYPKNWDMSYAFPRHKGKEAWEKVIELIKTYQEAGEYPINLAVHSRFTAKSKSWLAPDHDRHTCWVEVTTARGTPEWREFYETLEELWFAIDGARPHWGKLYGFWDPPELHTCAGGSQGSGGPLHPNWSTLASRYPKMAAFRRVRQDWDPKRIFLNPFLEEKIFQLGPRVRARLQPFDSDSAVP